MKPRISLTQLFGADLGAEVAVGAAWAFAFKTGEEVEGTDIITAPAVGAGFFRVGKLHRARAV